MSTDGPLSCPVCRARFRGTTACSRCGAELTPLMVLALRAHRLRQSAREALRAGDFQLAHDLATDAEELCSTPQGARLRLVAGCLAW
ncbi:MAG: hypothetical protein HY815_28615 [Candidatus Riflebacteria bacterium]|nr:hypothetical protein [Candidatus Riflebacteria bacterium]